MLYDNGHGTRPELWTNTSKNGEFESGTLESGYYNSEQQWVEQKVTINRDLFLAISRAFEKRHDIAVEKEISRQSAKSAERATANQFMAAVAWSG